MLSRACARQERSQQRALGVVFLVSQWGDTRSQELKTFAALLVKTVCKVEHKLDIV